MIDIGWVEAPGGGGWWQAVDAGGGGWWCWLSVVAAGGGGCWLVVGSGSGLCWRWLVMVVVLGGGGGVGLPRHRSLASGASSPAFFGRYIAYLRRLPTAVAVSPTYVGGDVARLRLTRSHEFDLVGTSQAESLFLNL